MITLNGFTVPVKYIPDLNGLWLTYVLDISCDHVGVDVSGAQCVVSMMWALPNKTLDKFYFHFYKNLQQGSYVTVALAEASRAIKKDDRYIQTTS